VQTVSPITTTELDLLARADQIDASRIRQHGNRVYNYGAATMRDQAEQLRNQVRNAVYRRAGEATGQPSYANDYIMAGLRAQRAAGLTM